MNKSKEFSKNSKDQNCFEETRHILLKQSTPIIFTIFNLFQLITNSNSNGRWKGSARGRKSIASSGRGSEGRFMRDKYNIFTIWNGWERPGLYRGKGYGFLIWFLILSTCDWIKDISNYLMTITFNGKANILAAVLKSLKRQHFRHCC